MGYRISVAMAVYNGEKYIKQQVDSILSQLGPDDEIIVSDDGSTDGTVSVLEAYNDSRIKVVEGPHCGVKQNFSNAISHCGGDIIFLSDQDDMWSSKKVEKVLAEFESDRKIMCVVHDCYVVDGELKNPSPETFFRIKGSGSGIIRNMVKNTYIGCCMAFRSSLVKKIMPIPDNIEMHDQWIGILAEVEGRSSFIGNKLLKYRRHGGNVSNMEHYPLKKMIRNRVVFLVEFVKRLLRK